jgi:hypothetical protein
MSLQLDVYEPVASGGALTATPVPPRKPAYILSHGGGNSGGSKEQYCFQGAAKFYAARGMVAFNINYRLAHDKGLLPNCTVPGGCGSLRAPPHPPPRHQRRRETSWSLTSVAATTGSSRTRRGRPATAHRTWGRFAWDRTPAHSASARRQRVLLLPPPLPPLLSLSSRCNCVAMQPKARSIGAWSTTPSHRSTSCMLAAACAWVSQRQALLRRLGSRSPSASAMAPTMVPHTQAPIAPRCGSSVSPARSSRAARR